MCAIGVLSVTNNSRISSNYFESVAYHQTDFYTTLKRLLAMYQLQCYSKMYVPVKI